MEPLLSNQIRLFSMITFMYTSDVQLSFHMLHIICSVFCSHLSVSFSGTWTHTQPPVVPKPAMCICRTQWSCDTSGGFQFYALVGLRWGGPRRLVREREKEMTLTRPNTSVAVWRMCLWRWGRAIFHCFTVYCHRCSVLVSMCQTETLPLWQESIRR